MNVTPVTGKWVRFLPVAGQLRRKTGIWTVEATEDGTQLGVVRFYPRWRKYAFFPEDDTLFECDCLRDIANFCEARTREWRQTVRDRQAAKHMDENDTDSIYPTAKEEAAREDLLGRTK